MCGDAFLFVLLSSGLAFPSGLGFGLMLLRSSACGCSISVITPVVGQTVVQPLYTQGPPAACVCLHVAEIFCYAPVTSPCRCSHSAERDQREGHVLRRAALLRGLCIVLSGSPSAQLLRSLFLP